MPVSYKQCLELYWTEPTKNCRSSLEPNHEAVRYSPLVLVFLEDIDENLEEGLGLALVKFARLVAQNEELPANGDAVQLWPAGLHCVGSDEVDVDVHDLRHGTRNHCVCLGSESGGQVWGVEENPKPSWKGAVSYMIAKACNAPHWTHQL